MPLPYDLFEVKERLKMMGATSSMNIFLRQEIDRMQKVRIRQQSDGLKFLCQKWNIA